MRAIKNIAVALASVALLAAQSFTEQGIAAFSRGAYSDAAKDFQRALVDNPRDEHARTFLALTRAATGHCGDAVPDLEAQSSMGAPELQRLAGLALVQCFLALNQTTKAAPVVSQLEQRYPDDADVLYQSARVHMRAFNEATHRMFEKTPASYRVNELSAEIFETQSKFAEAAAEYRKAIVKNPNALNLHFRLGRAILLQSHDPDALSRAESEFEAELALNAEDAAAEFQIGQIRTAQGRARDGLLHYQHALALRPDFAEAALALGKDRLQAKAYAEAIPLLQQAAALQPRNEAAHYNLMLAYRDSGQAENARQEQEKLQELQRAPEGEFTDFLKKLGEKPAAQQ